MHILDDLQAIKKIDQQDVLSSLNLFIKQCLQALEETSILATPYHKEIDNIVIGAMGGSAFAGEIVQTLFKEEINVPIEIVRDYHLPKYVNSKTLFIALSYSGGTEETLSTLKEAREKDCQIAILSNGGKLKEIKEKENLFGYIFKEKYNPCHQPRVGSGYLILGLLGLLIKYKLINLNFDYLKEKLKKLIKFDLYQPKYLIKNNLAKEISLELKNKFVFLIGSEFLTGVIHGFANQLNETAKTNSAYHLIPELNHHRMEGLQFPHLFNKQAIFIFYPSQFYDKRNQLRYKITQEVIRKNHYFLLTFESKADDKFTQALKTYMFNAYVSFYLGILYGVNPSKIPWVDYFKNELKKQTAHDE